MVAVSSSKLISQILTYWQQPQQLSAGLVESWECASYLMPSSLNTALSGCLALSDQLFSNFIWFHYLSFMRLWLMVSHQLCNNAFLGTWLVVIVGIMLSVWSIRLLHNVSLIIIDLLFFKKNLFQLYGLLA